MHSDHAPAPVSESVPSRPIDIDERWNNLDLLRGVALAGILLANIRQLALPWGTADAPLAIRSPAALAWLDWIAFDAFVDLKFVTIFSLLFGVGFALQLARLERSEVAPRWRFARRLMLLAIFGLAHALLLYPAEVLFVYALAGVPLLIGHRAAPSTLLRVGIGLLAWTTLWAYQLSGTGSISIAISATAAALLVSALYALRRRPWIWSISSALAIVAVGVLLLTLPSGPWPPEPSEREDYLTAQAEHRAMLDGDSARAPAEYRVRQQGDLAALVDLHWQQFQQVLLYSILLLFWRTLALFLIGAGLHRLGVLARLSNPTWLRRCRAALIVGLILTIIASLARAAEVAGLGTAVWSQIVHQVSALLIASGIAGWVLGSTQPCHVGWWRSRLTAVGRTALSNYVLGQSLCLAALFEPWGAGWYARLDGPLLTLMAFGWFVVLAELSHHCLRFFRYGPMEWLWRCGTYGHWLPLRRSSARS